LPRWNAHTELRAKRQCSAWESGHQVQCPYRVAGKASALGAGSGVPKPAYFHMRRYNEALIREVQNDMRLNPALAQETFGETEAPGFFEVTAGFNAEWMLTWGSVTQRSPLHCTRKFSCVDSMKPVSESNLRVHVACKLTQPVSSPAL
jgi:hypothetical protein